MRDYSAPSTLFFPNNYGCNYTVLLRGLVEKAKQKWLRGSAREKKIRYLTITLRENLEK